MRVGILLLLALAPLTAQTPLIRTETRLVLVDAVVTDKEGQPVGDLTAKDFRLWEDGKEQPVQSASFGAANQTSSYVVLFFDNSTLYGAGIRVREAAARFIDANAGAGHWMAIVDFGGTLRTSQNFTGDAERLKRVIRETNPTPGATGFGGVSATGRGRGMGQLADAADQKLSALGLALRQLAQNLSNVPGRKAVLLFTAGSAAIAQGSLALTPAVPMLNRWNVSVYPVAASDVELAGPFYELAKGTGGFVSGNSHFLDRELERLRREKDGYYTLSYVPAETPDGSCHSLRVKLERPGAELRARSLYCNVKTVDLLAGTAAEKELESRVMGSETGKLTASLAVPYFYSEPDLARLHLAMEIPTKGLKFVKVKDKLQSELQILAIAYQPDGVEGARFSDTVKLSSPAPEIFHYEGQFEVASGKYMLKVLVSAGGENYGRVEQPLVVDGFDGKQLALSALALSKQIRPATVSAPGEDMQLMEGVAPLIYQNLRLVPSGDAWFRKGENAAIYGEVYEAVPPSGNPAPVEIRLSVTDLAAGKTTPAGSAKLDAFRPGEFAAIPFALNLSSLGPGRYRAEVEAVGAVRKRTLDFEVR